MAIKSTQEVWCEELARGPRKTIAQRMALWFDRTPTPGAEPSPEGDSKPLDPYRWWSIAELLEDRS
jgi:hypothetical protein